MALGLSSQVFADCCACGLRTCRLHSPQCVLYIYCFCVVLGLRTLRASCTPHKPVPSVLSLHALVDTTPVTLACSCAVRILTVADSVGIDRWVTKHACLIVWVVLDGLGGSPPSRCFTAMSFRCLCSICDTVHTDRGRPYLYQHTCAVCWCCLAASGGVPPTFAASRCGFCSPA